MEEKCPCCPRHCDMSSRLCASAGSGDAMISFAPRTAPSGQSAKAEKK